MPEAPNHQPPVLPAADQGGAAGNLGEQRARANQAQKRTSASAPLGEIPTKQNDTADAGADARSGQGGEEGGEGEEEEPTSRLGGAKQMANQLAAPAMALYNRKKIKENERQIKQKQKETKEINKELKDEEKKISKLNWVARAAKLADAGKAIGSYLSAAVPFWWWTIIGAIIDICITIPIIFLIYWLGFIKGAATKLIQKKLDAEQKKREKIVKQKKEKEKETMSLYREQQELTQLFQEPEQEEGG